MAGDNLWDSKRKNRKTGGWFDVKETASNETTDMFKSNYGWVDKRSGAERVSDDEIVRERRERRAQQQEEERSREHQYQQNKEEAQNAAKQNERSKKPRRKAMSKRYEKGSTIQIGGINHTVDSIISDPTKNDRLRGYMATDESGNRWFINRFGQKIKWDDWDGIHDDPK